MSIFHVLALSACVVYVQGQYDFDTSVRAGGLCAISYCPPPEIAAWDCKQCGLSQVDGFEWTHTFRNVATDLDGYAGVNRGTKEITFVFQGTDITSIQNILEDLVGVPVPLVVSNLDAEVVKLVHPGFQTSYLSLQSQVQAAWDELSKDPEFLDYKVLVTGHSLGGSIATLAAWDLSFQMPAERLHLYTFGAPRVATSGFAQALDERITNSYRFVNNADAIPHACPTLLDYIHHGQQIWDKRDGTPLRFCTAEQADCSASVFPLGISLTDHIEYHGTPTGSCQYDEAELDATLNEQNKNIRVPVPGRERIETGIREVPTFGVDSGFFG